MRTVTITIESSEGPRLNLRKRFVDGVVEIGIWRGAEIPTTTICDTHEDALNQLAELSAQFVREVG